MNNSERPSNRTEGEARAAHGGGFASIGMIRLLVIAIALLGTLGAATPALAQEELNDTGVEESSGSGQAIVDFALGYVGSPYVAAGNTPDGFDCSGFTQYVIMNTLGIDIGHGVPGQTGYGAWVDWDAWQPGDLVFFANTYDAGISHVGIYIGDGQFVHAENESTGVTISSVYSDYYSGHYYGAYRIG
jgi:cell wall-associated NlpC family hydrolase